MKTLKLIALATFALLFSQCKTTAPTEPVATKTSVLEVIQILDTLQHHFYDLAKSSTGNTSGQVVLMTVDWLKTQPNVKQVNWYDSLHIVVTMNSGLQANSIFNLVDDKGISIFRGGAPTSTNGNRLLPTSKNKITNKNILIYAPFGSCGNKEDFYKPGQLEEIADIFRNANKDFNVTVLECDKCTVKAIESFKDYGLVIIDTHGLPNGFLTGDIMSGLWEKYQKDIDGLVLALNQKFGTSGFINFAEGAYSFCSVRNIRVALDWKSFLEDQTVLPQLYQIVVNGKFINTLPSMPNTVILGNMCYSGWNNTVFIQSGQQIPIPDPIRAAFMSKGPISYYAYGFPDGTATPVENDFALKMEEYLSRAFAEDDDSTGIAHLSSSGTEYTEGQFLSESPNPTLPLRHYGADNYSFEDCIKEFTDERDGQKYKVVCIGSQTWMAENLKTFVGGGSCYDDEAANCGVFGKLYDWTTIMNGAAASNSNPSGVQGICPKGWHVPSSSEWYQLALFADAATGNTGGDALRDSVLWQNTQYPGKDKFGFKGLPAGKYIPQPGIYRGLHLQGYWWSTSIASASDNTYISAGLDPLTPKLTTSFVTSPETKISCRCVKDKP